MVPPKGEELNTLFDELNRWNELLKAENIDWDGLEAQNPQPEHEVPEP